MNIQGKHHHASDVITATVSQASRRMAHNNPPRLEYESYAEEYTALVDRKRAIELQLQGYTKTAFSQAQMKVRRGNIGNHTRSLETWIATKARMESERTTLLAEKVEIEKRLTQIKPHVKGENINQSRRDDLRLDVMLQQLDELKAIRQILEERLPKTTA